MPIQFLLVATVLIVAPSVLAQGPGMGRHSGGTDDPHNTIHALLSDHDAVDRRVVDLPNGVETWTESEDPEVASLIQLHVRQMKDRLESGQPMRRWDPLFAAIFEHANAIEMTIEDTPNGVHVLETSEDPEVVALIKQHAYRAINEFVERGMDRAHEPTPLPNSEPTQRPYTESPDVSSLPDFDEARFATAPLYQNDGYRVVGFSFREGQTLPEHAAPVDAYLIVTEGSARVSIGDIVHHLGQGEGIVLPKDVLHLIEATEDSRMVLVR